MKKVIAVKANNRRVLTTEATAKKNNWWITHYVTVTSMEDGYSESVDTECTPKIGNLVFGMGQRVYKINDVNPRHICCKCERKGSNRIGNLFYCDHDYKALTITQPILGTGNIPGRNQPCHCGSGKKYKHCCLAKNRHAPRHYFNSKYKQNEVSSRKTT